ncbi:MAG: hypothetical protein U0350_36280 [Caldilineaceae bacterium]
MTFADSPSTKLLVDGKIEMLNRLRVLDSSIRQYNDWIEGARRHQPEGWEDWCKILQDYVAACSVEAEQRRLLVLAAARRRPQGFGIEIKWDNAQQRVALRALGGQW